LVGLSSFFPFNTFCCGDHPTHQGRGVTLCFLGPASPGPKTPFGWGTWVIPQTWSRFLWKSGHFFLFGSPFFFLLGPPPGLSLAVPPFPHVFVCFFSPRILRFWFPLFPSSSGFWFFPGGDLCFFSDVTPLGTNSLSSFLPRSFGFSFTKRRIFAGRCSLVFAFPHSRSFAFFFSLRQIHGFAPPFGPLWSIQFATPCARAS